MTPIGRARGFLQQTGTSRAAQSGQRQQPPQSGQWQQPPQRGQRQQPPQPERIATIANTIGRGTLTNYCVVNDTLCCM